MSNFNQAISDFITVSTKSALRNAIDRRYATIIVEGELAAKVRKAYALNTVGKVSIAILSATLVGSSVVSPVTGGLSYLSLLPASAATGVSIPVLVAVVFIGLSLILAICKNYDLIELGYGKLKLRLKKS